MKTLQWPAVPSLDAAGQRVVDWLDGDVRTTPSHLGRPCRETRSIADDLRALNTSGGVVTDWSQPGESGMSGRQRACVVGLATPAAAARLRERALPAGMLWQDAPVLDVPESPYRGSWVPVTQGFTRGLLGTYTYCTLLPRSAMSFLIDSIDVPEDTVASWHSFAVADPVWGRRRTLWDALTAEVSS